MKRKYQVFVSSTYEDLKEERKAISQALLESNCIPAGMELFPASNKKSWDIIKKVIDESDYYLLVVAGKYGSTKKNNRGKDIGYTEMEYNYARKSKKPIIAFLHDDLDHIIAKNAETTEHGKQMLADFRAKILGSHYQVSFWHDTGTLVSKIKDALHNLIQSTPAAGWIKAPEIDAATLEKQLIQRSELVDNWGLEKIFRTRAEKNAESDPKLESSFVKQLDGIAFGLSSFRCNREKDVLKCLMNGMQVRLIAMHPDSSFVLQRDLEENGRPGDIAASIKELVKWVNKLNTLSPHGKIEIKYYNAMTLDFYWRLDDELYVGPYLYNIVSQQTITYKYVKGGRGFNMYSDYFESLWNNNELCSYPADFIRV